MAASSLVHRHVTLEVHLPKIVRLLTLEPYKGPMLLGFPRLDQTATKQDLPDCAWRRQCLRCRLSPGQHPPDLPRAPSRMLTANLHHRLLHFFTASPRAVPRPTRPIHQAFPSALAEAGHPLVAALAAYR